MKRTTYLIVAVTTDDQPGAQNHGLAHCKRVDEARDAIQIVQYWRADVRAIGEAHWTGSPPRGFTALGCDSGPHCGGPATAHVHVPADWFPGGYAGNAGL